MDFSGILQLIFTGLTLGGVYALIALGFVIIYNVSGIINFAQGEFVMLGAMITVSINKAGMPVPAAAALAIFIVMAVGAVTELLSIRPAKHASIVTLIIITIGVSIILRGAALLIWGTSPYMLPAFSKGAPLSIGGAAISLQSLWVIATVVIVVIFLYIFFELTYWGKAVRACFINKAAAKLMGINIQKMSLMSFIISAGMAALGGIVVAPITSATYDMGLILGLKGFIAAVLGGLTSAPGAVIGGLIIGVAESLGAGLISSGYKDAISFVILIIVLLLKPGGIFGAVGNKRV